MNRCYTGTNATGTTSLLFFINGIFVSAQDGRVLLNNYVVGSHEVKQVKMKNGYHYIIGGELDNLLDIGAVIDLEYEEKGVQSLKLCAQRMRQVLISQMDKESAVLLFGTDIDGSGIYKVGHSGSTLTNQSYHAIGNGATHALELIEKYFQENTEPSVAEVCILAEKALVYACLMSDCTGGTIRVFEHSHEGIVSSSTSDAALFLKHFNSYAELNAKSLFILADITTNDAYGLQAYWVKHSICTPYYGAVHEYEHLDRVYVTELHCKPRNKYKVFIVRCEDADFLAKLQNDIPAIFGWETMPRVELSVAARGEYYLARCDQTTLRSLVYD